MVEAMVAVLVHPRIYSPPLPLYPSIQPHLRGLTPSLLKQSDPLISSSQIHWAREVPNEKKDVVEMYLKDDCAAKYRQMDLDANDGHLPQRTVLHENICFCLIKPTYDQCADPIYTQVHANLPVWHKHRTKWHAESQCGGNCACKTALWFRSISSSEEALNKGLLCQPVKCPELQVKGDNGETPTFNKPCCTHGECDSPDCIAAKLEQIRKCKTEFSGSNEKIRYRKYVKMTRFRSDGSEYHEIEFVYVEETLDEFVATMLSSIEAAVAHRGDHHWAERQKKLVIEKLLHAGSLEQLAVPGCTTVKEKMAALLACDHVNHLKITDHDIVLLTDFAAKVKYENFSSSTCEHPAQGTLCIAVVLHSPAERAVRKDVTETEELPTGLESLPVSDTSKAPKTVKLGKAQIVEVQEQTLICDVFCGYSDESGHARFDQTFMRDIVCYYKFGHFVHATAATHRGEPVPIGKDAAAAKPSAYDEKRLKRLAAIRAAQEAEAEADAIVRAEAESAAAAADAAAPAAEAGNGKANKHKQRKSAGSSKAKATAHPESTVDAACLDRRGKLINMRMLIKWTDGCGVQYVQREAALGTASLYGDIEALAKKVQMEFGGVIGLHIVFEPHCFKGIHDAAGKVFVDYKNKGVKGRQWTISNIEQHYDFNAAHMLKPETETFNFEKVFSFKNYIHVLYMKSDFISLEAEAVDGIKSWRCTEGGTDSCAIARAGAGGGLGFSFRARPHICFCESQPCAHGDFTGEPSDHKVLTSTQDKVDREIATDFFDAIKEGTAIASKGDVEDSTSGGEPIWFSLAKDTMQVADKPFKAAGGTGPSGTRTIATNWKYVDVVYLNKIKVDSQGNVHYEAWKHPAGDRTVLTKPKVLTLEIEWLRVEERRGNKPARYILSAAAYARLVQAVRE